MKRSWLAILPVLVFAGITAVVWKGLSNDPKAIPSVLIGKPVPAFNLPAVPDLGVPGFSDADLKKGGVTIVNIFASWCVPCRDEHPLISELAKRTDIRVVGINNKDEPGNAKRFLSVMGQPYAAIGADRDGRISIDWGGYGVPETFIVDGKGIIRFKKIGALEPGDLTGDFAKAIEKAM